MQGHMRAGKRKMTVAVTLSGWCQETDFSYVRDEGGSLSFFVRRPAGATLRDMQAWKIHPDPSRNG
ncbi:hypothetical protein PUN4_450016 [Paraburkholderia unamae]|nr:hypothetical protein PUN4_450016 [Paraburkholderia unamae]